MRKKLAFLDTSLDDLRAFPESSRQEIGYQLDRIQQGLNPYDWKPFSTIGLVCERFVLAMLMGSIASCMSQNLKKRFTYCIVFKRKHRLPVNRILI